MKKFFQKDWWVNAGAKMKAVSSKKWWIVAGVVLLLVVVAVSVALLAVPQTQNSETPGAEETVATEETAGTVEETATGTEETTESKSVNVEILDYEFVTNEYLSSLVSFREIADTAETDVEVYTTINGKEYTVFTVVFDSTEGDIVHMVQNAEGDKIPVAFFMNTLPEGLSEEEASEFYTAQGVVNEIMHSIRVK